MGSGGDGRCDVCRSVKCECRDMSPDGELFGARRWASWESAIACFKPGSLVLCRLPNLGGGYLYRFVYWSSGTELSVPAGAYLDEYLLVAKPTRPYLPIMAKDLPTRQTLKNFWKLQKEVGKWLMA